MIKHPAVYICASSSRVIYVGVTSNLTWRMWKHRNGLFDGFAKKFFVDKLVYFESYADMKSAIAREKQIKGWDRAKKIALIESMNPGWEDLAKSLVVLPTVPPYTKPEPDRR